MNLTEIVMKYTHIVAASLLALFLVGCSSDPGDGKPGQYPPSQNVLEDREGMGELNTALEAAEQEKTVIDTIEDAVEDAVEAVEETVEDAVEAAEEAFDAMNEGDLDAFVYDTPVLRYLKGKDIYSGMNLSEETFEQQTFGIAGNGSFKELNGKILEFISDEEWDDILNKYSLK